MLFGYTFYGQGHAKETLAQGNPTKPDTEPQQPLAKYLADHFWDGLDTSQVLNNTAFYGQMLSDYITLCEQAYPDDPKACIDRIMQKFNPDGSAAAFAVDYLTSFLMKAGQESLLRYLDETYGDYTCKGEGELSYQLRMEGCRALRPGNPAPNISLGKLKLNDLKGDKIIVAFWAGWCNHCVEEMPKLNAAITQYSGVSVVAISLDTDPGVFKNASAKLANIMHFCDFKKWAGEAAQKFYITATPTFFLLDKDHNIIDKYSSVQTLVNYIDEQ